MSNIVVCKNMLDRGHGSRFLMARIAAAMLFPAMKDVNKRVGFEKALITNLNLNFYREHKTASLSGDDLIEMLNCAALSDLSLLANENTHKKMKVGFGLGIGFGNMLFGAKKKGGNVGFWSEENIEISGGFNGLMLNEQKKRESDVLSFRPALSLWAASSRIAYERGKAGLDIERIPCEMGELKKFIQYSMAYQKEGENYRQSHSSKMFLKEDKCFRLILDGVELPEIVFAAKEETS